MLIMLIVLAIIGTIWFVCLGCLGALVVFFSAREHQRRKRMREQPRAPIRLTIEDERWLEKLLERTG